MDDSDRERRWWERSFAERQAEVEAAYGPSQPPGSPPGYVVPFEWDLDDAFIPGGCCLVCPPQDAAEPPGESHAYWLYATLGLSQPMEREEVKAAKAGGAAADEFRHRYGLEYGVMTDEPAEWAPPVLRQLMWYVRTHLRVAPGDRMPMGFERSPGGVLTANIGDQAAEGVAVEGPMRAMLFWPNLTNRSTFATRTGNFQLLVGTTITAAEWEFARRTSGEHLLVLLQRAGVGQRSDPYRQDVAAAPRWEEQRRRVESMDVEEARAELLLG